jgi:membrane-anchored protein YejM (alkaline phosphatase superfamily)
MNRQVWKVPVNSRVPLVGSSLVLYAVYIAVTFFLCMIVKTRGVMNLRVVSSSRFVRTLLNMGVA